MSASRRARRDHEHPRGDRPAAEPSATVGARACRSSPVGPRVGAALLSYPAMARSDIWCCASGARGGRTSTSIILLRPGYRASPCRCSICSGRFLTPTARVEGCGIATIRKVNTSDRVRDRQGGSTRHVVSHRRHPRYIQALDALAQGQEAGAEGSCARATWSMPSNATGRTRPAWSGSPRRSLDLDYRQPRPMAAAFAGRSARNAVSGPGASPIGLAAMLGNIPAYPRTPPRIGSTAARPGHSGIIRHCRMPFNRSDRCRAGPRTRAPGSCSRRTHVPCGHPEGALGARRIEPQACTLGDGPVALQVGAWSSTLAALPIPGRQPHPSCCSARRRARGAPRPSPARASDLRDGDTDRTADIVAVPEPPLHRTAPRV